VNLYRILVSKALSKQFWRSWRHAKSLKGILKSETQKIVLNLNYLRRKVTKLISHSFSDKISKQGEEGEGTQNRIKLETVAYQVCIFVAATLTTLIIKSSLLSSLSQNYIIEMYPTDSRLNCG